MNENDLTRLRHMRDAAIEVMTFIQGKSLDNLEDNQLLVRGLTASIGIIGEAASKISHDFRDLHPHIPWEQIVGMRNRLIHGYFDIKLDRLWYTATVAVPELLIQLKPLIPPDEGQ